MDNSSPTQENKSLEQFVDELIDQKGYPDLTAEVRDEMKRDLLDRVDSFLTARMIAELSDEDVAKFEEMLKSEVADQEIQNFLTEHIDNFTEFVTKTLLEFKGVYLGTIAVPA